MDEDVGTITRRSRIVAVGLGVTGAAVIHKGAFFPPTSLALSLLLSLLALYKPRFGSGDAPLLAGIGGLALWWLGDTLVAGDLLSAMPFLGGILGFGSAYALACQAGDEERVSIARGIVAMGAIVALSGLAGASLHYAPLAIESDGLWRLAGTITYANAAGFLLAMAIPLSCFVETRPRWLADVASYLLVAALVATMSRGALLSAAVALPVVARPFLDRRLVPGILGLAAGVVAIFTSGRIGAQPYLAAALAAGAVGTVLLAPPSRRRWFLAVAAACTLAVLITAATGGLAGAVELRSRGTNVEARLAEWRAALGQFGSSPLVGTGPEERLVIYTSRGRQIARFAHNEYLQVAASSGAVGLALLLAVFALAVRQVRSGRAGGDAIRRAAVASLLVFALAGASDFSWHLPAITIMAGWLAGISGPRRTESG